MGATEAQDGIENGFGSKILDLENEKECSTFLKQTKSPRNKSELSKVTLNSKDNDIVPKDMNKNTLEIKDSKQKEPKSSCEEKTNIEKIEIDEEKINIEINESVLDNSQTVFQSSNLPIDESRFECVAKGTENIFSKPLEEKIHDIEKVSIEATCKSGNILAKDIYFKHETKTSSLLNKDFNAKQISLNESSTNNKLRSEDKRKIRNHLNSNFVPGSKQNNGRKINKFEFFINQIKKIIFGKF